MMVWKKVNFPVQKQALWDEISHSLFQAEIDLIDFAVEHYYDVKPCEQASEIVPTYYARRTPEDSRINPELSIVEQFNQIRVCDPNRFPAYFDLHGQRYKLTLEKMNDQATDD